MPAGIQLAIVFVPWALCGMAAAHAKQRGESAAIPIAVFALWAITLTALLAAGALNGHTLFG